MLNELTLNVSLFKAQSLRLMDDLASGKLDRIVVTKRGKPLAVVVPSLAEPSDEIPGAYGSMKGRSRQLSPEPLTDPIYDGPLPSDPFIGHDPA